MFDYQQRPATNEYRDNWERIWGKRSKYFVSNADGCICSCHYIYDECCIECKEKEEKF